MKIDDAAFQGRPLLSVGNYFRAAFVIKRDPVVRLIDRRVEQVEITAKQQRFELTVESEPQSVILDPNTWTLMQARFEKR